MLLMEYLFHDDEEYLESFIGGVSTIIKGTDFDGIDKAFEEPKKEEPKKEVDVNDDKQY